MTKSIQDTRTPEIKALHKLKPTWETANPVAKEGLPPPPDVNGYKTPDAYAEAKNS